MSTPTTPNVGTIITSPRARKIIYGTYAGGALVVGAVGAYFLGIGHGLPEVVVGAQAVVAYLGIPLGALALANTPSQP